MALQMKTACEKCGSQLGGEAEAYICVYECTFCQPCTDEMQMKCPNCGNELVRRPRQVTPMAGNAGD